MKEPANRPVPSTDQRCRREPPNSRRAWPGMPRTGLGARGILRYLSAATEGISLSLGDGQGYLSLPRCRGCKEVAAVTGRHSLESDHGRLSRRLTERASRISREVLKVSGLAGRALLVCANQLSAFFALELGLSTLGRAIAEIEGLADPEALLCVDTADRLWHRRPFARLARF